MGDVLELACGTGIWTNQLTNYADHVTAVDASPEVLALNRDRTRGVGVTYVEADLFTWRPPRRYDVVFFSFWLSHVPPDRFPTFWAMVADSLTTGGRAVFLDNLWRPGGWPAERPMTYEQERTDLSDGLIYRVVKRYWEASELAAALDELGWDAEVDATERFFIRGVATPPGSSRPPR